MQSGTIQMKNNEYERSRLITEMNKTKYIKKKNPQKLLTSPNKNVNAYPILFLPHLSFCKTHLLRNSSRVSA